MPLSASTSPSPSECHNLLSTFCGSKLAHLRAVEARSVSSPLPPFLACACYLGSAFGCFRGETETGVCIGCRRRTSNVSVLPPAKADMSAIFLEHKHAMLLNAGKNFSSNHQPSVV